MQVRYAGDNEAPTTMSLDQLIRNFNESDGWKFGHNETDMRDELDGRGWYEGLHENGHYIVLNLAKLGLEASPPVMERQMKTKFHEMAEQQGIPLRTLDQVRQALDEAKKLDADDAMARLMLRHGRLTDEAILYIGDNYPSVWE